MPARPAAPTVIERPPVDISGLPKPASLILGDKGHDKGTIKACEHNAKELMAAAKQYDGLHFDKFLYRVRIGERDWSDADDRDAVCWLQSAYQVAGFTLGQTRTAALALAHARPHDSLFEFVMGLPEWDGTARIDRAFTDAWGAPDTVLMHAASRNFFLALHARAVKPGAQVDNLWAIEGPQGKLKSASLRALGEHFHAEISAQIGTADFLRELRGIWIAELSELDSLRGREASTVKRLLSAPSDRFVEKYEKHASAYPRRAVAVATTNEATYWQDSTGARRLIPIAVTNIRLDLIAELRLQWFAEARQLYQAGATWWEFPEGILEAQEERQNIDPWEDALRDAIENGQLDQDGYARPWPEGWIASAVILRDWLRVASAQQGRASSTRLGHVMRRLGFEPRRSNSERGWIRS
jgi:predicted P-loop ATPase